MKNIHTALARLSVSLAALTMGLTAAANAQTYDIVSLGNTDPQALNNKGQVVGLFVNAQGKTRAFEYNNGQIQTLFPTITNSISALGINDRGQIVGSGPTGPYVYDSNTGVMKTLGVPAGMNNFATAINQNGDVTGTYTVPFRDSHPFIYSSSTGQLLTIYGMNGVGGAAGGTAINNLGQVVGSASVPNPGISHAFLYSNGVIQDLGTLGGRISESTGINDRGEVIGDSFLAGDKLSQAFLYRNGTMENIGAIIDPGSFSFADGINSAGDIVGQSGSLGGYLYRNGVAQSLDSLIDPSLGWNIAGATAINDRGQIIGGGYLNGVATSFLLTPRAAATPEPTPALVFVVGLGVSLLALRRRKSVRGASRR